MDNSQLLSSLGSYSFSFDEAAVRNHEIEASHGDEVAPENTSARLDRDFRGNGQGRRIIRSNSSRRVGDYPLETFVADVVWLAQENPALFLQDSFQAERFGVPGGQNTHVDYESAETGIQDPEEAMLPPQRQHESAVVERQFPTAFSAVPENEVRRLLELLLPGVFTAFQYVEERDVRDVQFSVDSSALLDVEEPVLDVQFPVDLSLFPDVEETCSICLQPLDGHASVAGPADWRTSHAAVMVKCSHLFGGYCLSTWIYDSLKESCPMCRAELVRHANVNYTNYIDDNDDEDDNTWYDAEENWDEEQAINRFGDYFLEHADHEDHLEIEELEDLLDGRRLFRISRERLQREFTEVFYALASSNIDARSGQWGHSAEYRERARMIMRAMAFDMKCERDLVGMRLLRACFEPFEDEVRLSAEYTDEEQLAANVIILISNFKEMTELWLQNVGNHGLAPIS